MNEETIQQGLKELNLLASTEYHQSLAEVLDQPDAKKVVERLGRLVGVLIKEPFAVPVDLAQPSEGTGAYRAWRLSDAQAFDAAAGAKPWQYELLEQIRVDVDGFHWPTTFDVAVMAQHEAGFFGLYARLLHKYICGDKEVRKRIDNAFKGVKLGGPLKAPTPESIVGAGGLALLT